MQSDSRWRMKRFNSPEHVRTFESQKTSSRGATMMEKHEVEEMMELVMEEKLHLLLRSRQQRRTSAS
ncbi:uncharacterized [Tachysurus ichikawai]